MAAAVLAAAFLFAALPLPARPIALPAAFITANRSRVVSHSHEPLRRLRISRRRGSGRGARRLELHHPDRSRRRHAQAGRASVSCRRAGDRCRRAEHGSRALHRDRACRRRPIRCAEKRATSSPTCGGSAGSASSRIRIRPSPACDGATGTPTSTRMEWLNADTEWRDERRGHLVRALLRVIRFVRPKRSPRCSIVRTRRSTRWDAITQRRPVVALAGADAHARAGWMDDDANGYRGDGF